MKLIGMAIDEMIEKHDYLKAKTYVSMNEYVRVTSLSEEQMYDLNLLC